MSKGSKEVEVKGTTALATIASFEADAQAGFEQMSSEDLALPFLKILTNMSPEIGELEGAAPGMLYNSVTGELFDGKKGILVVPCAYIRQYIEWQPRGQGNGAPVQIYPATSDILSKTHKEPKETKDFLDNGNYVETTANHYVLALNDDGAYNHALITMKATQLKKSRKWNSMMMSVKLPGKNGPFTPPMYSQIYKLTVLSESNDKGKWHGWEIERVGTIDDPALYAAAKSFAESISAGNVKVKYEADGDEQGTPSDSDDLPF